MCFSKLTGVQKHLPPSHGKLSVGSQVTQVLVSTRNNLTSRVSVPTSVNIVAGREWGPGGAGLVGF